MQNAVSIIEVAPSPSISDKPLTAAETQLLTKCEDTITKGIKTFKEVGDALVEIRDQDLYRIQYASFEEYCRTKWKITARHANRLMLAAECVENIKSDQLVSSVPTAVPETESCARALTKLSPPEQVKAAQIAAKKADKPTAKQFAEAAREVVGEKAKVKNSGKPSAPKPVTGKTSLEHLVELIDEAETLVKKDKPKDTVLAKLNEVAKLATKLLNGGVK